MYVRGMGRVRFSVRGVAGAWLAWLALNGICSGSAGGGLVAPVRALSAGMSCRKAVIEGEVRAGQPFFRALGNGLELYLQPIASGWIIRVVPVADAYARLDYAELATPPYNSVTALSVSTDFAFRAQDAVGWNPRRFRFATSAGSFARLKQLYERIPAAPGKASAGLERDLAVALEDTAPATLQIVDARLTPGTADQSAAAAAVAAHFNTTAHTLDLSGAPTPLGRLEWVRFRSEFELPAGFAMAPELVSGMAPGMRTSAEPCSSF